MVLGLRKRGKRFANEEEGLTSCSICGARHISWYTFDLVS